MRQFINVMNWVASKAAPRNVVILNQSWIVEGIDKFRCPVDIVGRNVSKIDRRHNQAVSHHKMTTEEYFYKLDVDIGVYGKIDVSVIDDDHVFEIALEQFIELERRSSSDGVILLHDVLPRSEEEASRTPSPTSWMGDVWKVVRYLRIARPDLKVTVLNDGEAGFAFITQLKPGIQRNIPDIFSSVTFKRILEEKFPGKDALAESLCAIQALTDKDLDQALSSIFEGKTGEYTNFRKISFDDVPGFSSTGIGYKVAIEETSYERIPPKFLSDDVLPADAKQRHNQFWESATQDVPSVRLMRVPGGRVFGEGVVSTADNIVISESMADIVFADHFCEGEDGGNLKLSFPSRKERHLAGKVAHITKAGFRNIGHWLFEMFPKIHVLKNESDFHDMKVIIQKFTPLRSFYMETLKLAGISPENIIEFDGQKEVISADELIYVSPMSRHNHMKAPAVFQFLGGVVERAQGEFSDAGTPKRIYVTRGRSRIRRLLNDEEIIPLFEENGFTVVDTEPLSVLERINLFKNADMIAGPIGAGLSHIAFCEPGKKVLVMAPDQGVEMFFWDICCHRSLNYFSVFGGAAKDDNGNSSFHSDFTVEKHNVRKMLEMSLR